MNSRFFYPTNEGSLGGARRLERSQVAVERELKRRLPHSRKLSEVSSQQAPTILIAEDNEDGRFMLRTLLEMKGYQVLEARNGSEAIESAVRDLPDLMLLDLQLPLIDGLNVARSLRSQAIDRYLPIVIISGHSSSTHSVVARAAGCDGYLLKPIDMIELEKVLDNFAPFNGKTKSAMAAG